MWCSPILLHRHLCLLYLFPINSTWCQIWYLLPFSILNTKIKNSQFKKTTNTKPTEIQFFSYFTHSGTDPISSKGHGLIVTTQSSRIHFKIRILFRSVQRKVYKKQSTYFIFNLRERIYYISIRTMGSGQWIVLHYLFAHFQDRHTHGFNLDANIASFSIENLRWTFFLNLLW